MRGGLTLVVGVLAGNILGFGRVARTASFLGTQSGADSLAVAMGPMDTLNSVMINSVVFAFVPMLTACAGAERTALFLKLNRCLVWVFTAVAAAVILGAPWLMRALEGLEDEFRRPPRLSQLAIEAGVHPKHHCLVFRRHFQCTVGAYANRLRVECARHMLISTERQLGVIALQAGFSDQPHFTRRFRAAFGVTPAHYRRLMAARRIPAHADGSEF